MLIYILLVMLLMFSTGIYGITQLHKPDKVDMLILSLLLGLPIPYFFWFYGKYFVN